MAGDTPTTLTGDPDQSGDGEWLVVKNRHGDVTAAAPTSESTAMGSPDDAVNETVVYTDADRPDRYGRLEGLWFSDDNRAAHDDPPHAQGWLFSDVDIEYTDELPRGWGED